MESLVRTGDFAPEDAELGSTVHEGSDAEPLEIHRLDDNIELESTTTTVEVVAEPVASSDLMKAALAVCITQEALS